MPVTELIIHINAPPEVVWARLADLGSHADWMADAEAIQFRGEQRQGVGTEMRVPTKVGLLRTNDRMVVTEWDELRAIGVRHEGLVSGEGRFEIRPRDGASELVWSERLEFPWWLGGGLTALLARPILRRIWRANLGRFRGMVESG